MEYSKPEITINRFAPIYAASDTVGDVITASAYTVDAYLSYTTLYSAVSNSKAITVSLPLVTN